MRLIQTGPRDAKVVAVGEAPGAKEDETGIPFTGAAGELLDRMLSQASLRRDEIFITNICHVRPLGNEFKWFLKPKPRPELLSGILQLRKDIVEIKPNLVIALGDWPLFILCGKHGITKWRGSILESSLVKGQKVIPTLHPAGILRIWDNKAVADVDFRRFKEEAKFPEIRLPQRDLILNPPATEMVRLAAELAKAEWLAIDIECTENPDRTWRLSCVGFSDRPDRAVVIPASDNTQLSIITALCACPAKKIFQNGQFDITVLEDNGIKTTNVAWDTMYGHHAIYPECAGGGDEVKALSGRKEGMKSALAKGLGFQTSIYTREPFYKDDGKLWKETGDLQLFWKYNARDAAVTREIQSVQMVELAEFGTYRVFEHEMALQPLLMHMTRTGLLIDTVEVKRLKGEYEEQISRLQDFLDKGAGRGVNVKSNKDMIWLLYDKLGLPMQKNRESGNPTADKYALGKLAMKVQNPLLATILEIRARRDDIERYLDVQLDGDNCWRALFDPSGTRTGRLASRANIYGTGNNLQNIPPKLRRIFIARPGKVMFYVDYSQAEARVVAYLSRCQALINLFSSGRDIHSVNAIRFFGLTCSEAEVKEQYDGLRFAAKRTVHGSNYGEQPPRIVESANDDARRLGQPHRLTLDVARKGQEAYFMLYPEIRSNFWYDVVQALKHNRILTTPFGRKRQFFARWDEKLFNAAYAYIPQSIVGDMACKAMIDLWQAQSAKWQLPSGAEILVNAHDALLGECNETDLNVTLEIVHSMMNIEITIHGETFTIPTDTKVGHNWADASESNPKGLKKLK